jgi:pimeloyl-ACP methyl ester carboxylesterase
MSKVRCYDIEICYEALGRGFRLVMIAGLSASMEYWEPKLVEETSKKYKTVIFDNRGAGRTDAPQIDYSIKMFADDTARLMDNLKIRKAHVLGHSMGGMIAQEFALTHPQRVEKLVLCSTNCGASRSVNPEPRVVKLLTDTTGTPADRMRNVMQITYTDDFIKRVESKPELMKLMIEKITSTYRTPTSPP